MTYDQTMDAEKNTLKNNFLYGTPSEQEKKKKPKRKKKLPVFVTAEELLALIKVSKIKHHRLAYYLAWYSGLRISEVLRLEAKDVNLEKGLILVIEGKGGKDGMAILPQTFIPAMVEMMPLNKFCKVRALQKAFKQDSKKSGMLEMKPTVHFHSLRHGFCTHAVEKGIDITRVQVLARHSNIATTNIYTHLNPKYAIEDFRRLF